MKANFTPARAMSPHFDRAPVEPGPCRAKHLDRGLLGSEAGGETRGRRRPVCRETVRTFSGGEDAANVAFTESIDGERDFGNAQHVQPNAKIAGNSPSRRIENLGIHETLCHLMR